MLKLRITFVDDNEGGKELGEALEEIRKDFKVISESKIYKGRGKSIYSNIYLDVEKKLN